MYKRNLKVLAAVLSLSMLLGGVSLPSIKASAEEVKNGWYEEEVTKGDFKGQMGWFWYEDGVKQGTEGRGKEIAVPVEGKENEYDWFWLDSIDGGKKAVAKDTYQDSDAGKYADEYEAKGKGKWCRYDAEGRMIKGWAAGDGKEEAAVAIASPDDAGDKPVYYFDPWSGAMAKGVISIDGKLYKFDTTTGQLEKDKTQDKPEGFKETGWNVVDGIECFFFEGVKQGVFGRGKEICDPETNQWYWLDAENGGQKAVDKDVYIESGGEKKWVHYDKDGQMKKGWSDDKQYYYDPTSGEMAKGYVTIDGKTYHFDESTGVCLGETTQKVVTYSYDTYRPTESVTTDKDGKVISRTVNTYKVRDNESYKGYPDYDEEHRYEVQDGEEVETSYYIYDENGNTKESMWRSWDYVYDEETNSSKPVYYNEVTKYENKLIGKYYQTISSETTRDGESYSKEVYEIDEANQRASGSKSYSYDKEKKEYVESGRREFKYDDNGNRISIIYYSKDADGKEYKSTEYTYKFKFIQYEGSTEGWYYQTEYEYVGYNPDGKVDYKSKTEYDRGDDGSYNGYKSYSWDHEKEEYYLSSVTTYKHEKRTVGKGDNAYQSNIELEYEYCYFDYTHHDKVRRYTRHNNDFNDINIAKGHEVWQAEAQYKYDEDGNYLGYDLFDSVDAAKKAAELTQRYVYEYNDKYMEDGEHKDDYVQTTVTYDKDGKMIQTMKTNYKKYTYTYTYTYEQ